MRRELVGEPEVGLWRPKLPSMRHYACEQSAGGVESVTRRMWLRETLIADNIEGRVEEEMEYFTLAEYD